MLEKKCQKTFSSHLNQEHKRWTDGLISNFEYLSFLNKESTRSLNNLFSYPVFPHVFSNVDKDEINLLDLNIYRLFDRPIAVQNSRNIDKFEQIYEDLSQHHKLDQKLAKPHHFSNVYSSCGIVCRYLTRIIPFSCHAIVLQDGEFDVADRLFNNMILPCNGSIINTSDTHELTPEFFYFPEIFQNIHGLLLGKTQSGESVDNVNLPKWCKEDPRLFVMVHRQALESKFVRQNLHFWIDLIFGCKQRNEPAKNATNLFHPLTYQNSSQENEVSVEVQNKFMKALGVVTCRLFRSPHESSSQIIKYFTNKNEPVFWPSWSIHNRVKGLQWGEYVGSPINSNKPIIKSITTTKIPIYQFYCFQLNTYKKSNIYFNHWTDKTEDAMFFRYDDKGNNISIYDKKQILLSRLLLPNEIEMINVISSSKENLLLGDNKGIIWVLKYLTSQITDEFCFSWQFPMIGHRGRPIKSICVSEINRMVISGCDNSLICSWDLSSQHLLQKCKLNGNVLDIKICEPTGDVVVLSKLNEEPVTQLWLLSINLQKIQSWPYKVSVDKFISKLYNDLGHIQCICTSNLPVGTNVNVIVGGCSNGYVIMWSIYDLNIVRIIHMGSVQSFTAISFSPRHDELWIANSQTLTIYSNQHK